MQLGGKVWRLGLFAPPPRISFRVFRGLFGYVSGAAMRPAATAFLVRVRSQLFESMTFGLPNKSVERTGTSRSARWQLLCQRRLIPVAHLGRSTASVDAGQ